MSSATSFPGTPAVFKHVEGDWSCKQNYLPLCRNINFESTNKDATIQEFNINGYKNGKISIYIKFDVKSNDLFMKYLEESQIPLSDLDRLTQDIRVDSPEEIKKIFSILSENNQIPESHLGKIKEIVAEGRCEPWKPTPHEDDFSELRTLWLMDKINGASAL